MQFLAPAPNFGGQPSRAPANVPLQVYLREKFAKKCAKKSNQC